VTHAGYGPLGRTADPAGPPRTYAEITRWIAEHGLTAATEMWDQYLSRPPGSPDPATWRTMVVFPVR